MKVEPLQKPQVHAKYKDTERTNSEVQITAWDFRNRRKSVVCLCCQIHLPFTLVTFCKQLGNSTFACSFLIAAFAWVNHSGFGLGRPGSWKNDFFLAAPKRSKLWWNDIYLYLRLFAKYGAKWTSQKIVIRVQSWDFGILAGEIGTRTLCRPKTTWRSMNEGTGMVAIESQHEDWLNRIFSGIGEPQFNEL